ncbi:TVP38/TMEM64 family inner membrane protein YdjZ [Jannaschia seosinensis]|uniref:TVP38/TMEM64 family membrane protein n=1 Tax=Jannaschia seosinensis TaxID=313367 RepID=A0A0M7BBT7_9RHOB|nr:TVP38/TMEM64 family protein [Jannaschia seosinensis]CUH39659.1 TVP38/TMEM64 family inner membrane protein YdjZ [Jannaschia seosinensis]
MQVPRNHFEPESSSDEAIVAHAATVKSIPAWQIWIWPALLIVLAFGMWLLPWNDWVPILRDFVADSGIWGVSLYLVIYVFVVILPLPAAAMSVVGGLAYGWWGFPLAMAGSLLGAVPPYLIGRTWLRNWMLRRIAGPRIHAADRAIAGNGFVFVSLLRLTPILPFTAQNWLLGLTDVGFRTYCAATLIGLAPGTLAMVWVGALGGLATLGASNVQVALAVGGLLLFGGFVFWLSRVAAAELRREGFHGPAG